MKTKIEPIRGQDYAVKLIASGAFTVAVFSTYLLLGLGTLSFMNDLNRFSGAATCVYLFAAATFALSRLSLLVSHPECVVKGETRNGTQKL